jgi:hypothetical protein
MVYLVFMLTMLVRLVLIFAGIRLFALQQDLALLGIYFLVGGGFALAGSFYGSPFAHRAVAYLLSAVALGHGVVACFGIVVSPIGLALVHQSPDFRFSAARVLRTPDGPVERVVVSGWARKPCPRCADWKTLAGETVRGDLPVGVIHGTVLHAAVVAKVSITSNEADLLRYFRATKAPQDQLRILAKDTMARCLWDANWRSLSPLGAPRELSCRASPGRPFIIDTVRAEKLYF